VLQTTAVMITSKSASSSAGVLLVDSALMFEPLLSIMLGTERDVPLFATRSKVAPNVRRVQEQYAGSWGDRTTMDYIFTGMANQL
jgi:hypothetical protein